MVNAERLKKLQELMVEKNYDKLLISDPNTVYYFTDRNIHPGERMMVLNVPKEGKPLLFINELFPQENDDDMDLKWFKDTDDSVAFLSESITDGETVGIDRNWPSGFLLRLMDKKNADYRQGSVITDEMRSQKDEEEKRLMREVSEINDRSITELVGVLDDKITEEEASELLLAIYKKNGAQGFSFSPIVAFGKNGADPHHENGQDTLKPGNSIIIDVGCRKDSYNADMTRTYFFKKVSDEHRKIYETVKKANEAAIEKIKPGVTFSELDLTARKIIEDAGYGKYFTHRLGHGIGLDVHEGDDVSSSNNNLVKPGMIFSIEPGIYIPGDMGVRIEDLVLVTEDGYELLNHVTKDLTVI